jgi:TolB-like protein/Flp pilus assembly protein TadD
MLRPESAVTSWGELASVGQALYPAGSFKAWDERTEGVCFVAPAVRDGEARSVWERLRHRKVVQWGLAYSAAAWGLLQVIGFVADAFSWPAASKQVATLLLLIGLPFVLVVSWYHGDRGHQRVTASESVILVLLLFLGGGVLWDYGRREEPTQAVERIAGTPKPAPARSATDSRPSIAVLPFENRSRLEDDVFLVDGIHDDILTQLSKIGAMKVIARTSVEQFRDTRLGLREIGQQLGVATVLEGGVQRAGDRVRVTVQLIDAATESHLWAENYDRELTASNIFEIQSEVARAIASALKAELMPAAVQQLATIPTRNLAAWEAYQNARQRLVKRTITSLSEASNLFRKAIELDPEFALAYAGLADATWLAAEFNGQPWEPAVAKAEDLIGKALRLDPNLAEARVTLAKFAEERREPERAEVLYREAIALDPGYPQAYHWYSQLLASTGRDEEALSNLRRAVELDPMAIYLRAALASLLSGMGRFDASRREYELALEIDPQSPRPYLGIGAILSTGYGRLDLAVPYLQKALDLDPGSPASVHRLSQVYLDLGDDAQVERLMEYAHARGIVDPPAGGYLHLQRGDQAAALFTKERRLLRDVDLRRNEASSALARYQQEFPQLFAPELRSLDWRDFDAAVELAFVLQAVGESGQATRLLELCESFLTTGLRLGPFGYGVADVQVLAMMGRAHDALAALRSAAQAGWRGPYWRYHRDFDPTLASIRDDPGFKAVFADIARDMARQRAALAARAADAPLPLLEASN